MDGRGNARPLNTDEVYMYRGGQPILAESVQVNQTNLPGNPGTRLNQQNLMTSKMYQKPIADDQPPEDASPKHFIQNYNLPQNQPQQLNPIELAKQGLRGSTGNSGQPPVGNFANSAQLQPNQRPSHTEERQARYSNILNTGTDGYYPQPSHIEERQAKYSHMLNPGENNTYPQPPQYPNSLPPIQGPQTNLPLPTSSNQPLQTNQNTSNRNYVSSQPQSGRSTRDASIETSITGNEFERLTTRPEVADFEGGTDNMLEGDMDCCPCFSTRYDAS